LLVIDKPGGIPVHPSGRYRFNSLVHIMRYVMGYTSLFPVNRLDRLTSGLMFLCTTKERAREMETLFSERRIRKTYVARVEGEFPQEVVCTAKIKTVAHKVGLNVVDEMDGKACTTAFRRLSFNGNTSVVECKPTTGRTHQIRVHLLHLGYPIVNDPLYSRQDVRVASQSAQWNSVIQTMLGESLTPTGTCEACQQPLLPDPTQSCIYLHAHVYEEEGGAWRYQSPLPAWVDT
jgi:tRNA pseudouridine synthase 9